jgi:hypothetical protein
VRRMERLIMSSEEAVAKIVELTDVGADYTVDQKNWRHSANDRDATSTLSCQVHMSAALAGLRVTMAAEY